MRSPPAPRAARPRRPHRAGAAARAALRQVARGHYNLISALHKSVRGSDPDAALYWLARMLDGGEDPLYIARRLVRMAIEDIGLADPQAADAGARRQGRFRLPRHAPRASWRWRSRSSIWPPRPNPTPPTPPSARPCARQGARLAWRRPSISCNAPTRLMKEQGYGAGYEYDHDHRRSLLRAELLPRRHDARGSSTRRRRVSRRRSRSGWRDWAKLRDKRGG